MKDRHYKEQLSAFVDQELSTEDRQTIAEHLLHCEGCRSEYQKVKLGAACAARMPSADAPAGVWKFIDDEVRDGSTPSLEAFAKPRWFDVSHFGAFATAVLVVGLIAFFVLRATGPNETQTVAENQQPNGVGPEVGVVPINDSVQPTGEDPAAAIQTLPETTESASAQHAATASWDVETLAGAPKVAGAISSNKLPVGEYLETDGSSRARIEVASIGNVEVGPNSRVKLVGTNEQQHRLSLERGSLHARIAAPPRLFIVDTPSAAAVDLGCEYTLEVDQAGNSKLKVASGFVALEHAGRESIVPAGAACLTMKGKGLGTPFSLDATPEFERALRSFDFANGGSRAVGQIVKEANLYDIVSLWHLLSRVKTADRELVYDTLAKYVTPPVGVTREGVLSLNKPMLEKYREAVETVWFE
jgi:hypothetical protein